MLVETTTNGILIDLTPPTLSDKENFLGNAPLASTFSLTANITSNGSLDAMNNMTMSRENQNNPRIRFRCSKEQLMSSWDEFEDLESGVVRYEWCVGTAKALCDVVSLRPVETKTRDSAIVSRLPSGVTLFSTVYAVNGAKLRNQLISDPCTVISVAPRVANVIDKPSVKACNFTDIDWKATVQSLSFGWNFSGNYLNDVLRLRIQVAVTMLSSNLSVPQVIQEKSWKGEPLKQPFTEILPWKDNVAIQNVLFQPWEITVA